MRAKIEIALVMLVCSWISIDLIFIRARQREAINQQIEKQFESVSQRKGKWAQDAEFVGEKVGFEVEDLPSNK